MLSIEEFEKVYTNKLKNSFKSFDTRRKIGVAIDLIGFIPFVGTFLVLLPITIFTEDLDNKSAGILLAIGAFGGFIFLMLMKFIVEKIHTPLSKQYHEKIINPIVNSISPEWQMSIDGSVGSIEVGASKLFDKNYDEYSGSNLVYGKIDKTDFRSSLLKIAFKKSYPQDSTPLFNGFFFHADFNKHFNGETIVVNGDLLDMAVAFKNMVATSNFAVLENPEFNKVFKVKTTDQTEARYILTPVIMEKILKIYKYYKGPIRFSFIGKRVYCAINRTDNLFKLPFYKAINTWKFVEKIYELYSLNAVLVKELNLNTRIWTKE